MQYTAIYEKETGYYWIMQRAKDGDVWEQHCYASRSLRFSYILITAYFLDNDKAIEYIRQLEQKEN